MSGWISVSERLPLDPDESIRFESTSFLVTDGSIICIGDFQQGHGCGKPWADWSDYCNIPKNKITHWQPLPEPPK